MNLHDAFDQAVRKYYEGFDYSATNKASDKPFEYDFKTLDKLHKEIVPKGKRGKKVMDEPEAIDNPTEEAAEDVNAIQ